MQYDMQNMGPSRNAFELIYDGLASFFNHLIPLFAILVPIVCVVAYLTPETGGGLSSLGDTNTALEGSDAFARSKGAGMQLIILVVTVLAQVTTWLVLDFKSRGQVLPMEEALIRSLRLLPMVAILYMCLGVLFVLGLALFVIPGILVMACLVLAPTIYVVEGGSILESMKASREMVRGHMLRILTIMFCVWFFTMCLYMGLGILGAAIGVASVSFMPLLRVAIQVVTLGCTIIGAAIWYEFYRDRKQVIEHSSSGHELYDYTLPEASSLSS